MIFFECSSKHGTTRRKDRHVPDGSKRGGSNAGRELSGGGDVA